MKKKIVTTKDKEPKNELGQLHGLWETYWGNGKPALKGNFINGKRDGYYECYYDNGNLSYKGHYVDDKEHGYWEHHHYDGKVEYKGNYDMGVTRPI
jgi:antitoxin component YwqK of YwqJK toxin-antitoxin module